MKKTISVLLSLLMVLGAMTCLFTAPVSAAEASETITAVPKDLLNGEGGFESYANGQDLEGSYTEATTKTGGSFRYYNPVPATDGKWTGWDPNLKGSNLSTETSNAIKAAGGVVDASVGLTGMQHYKGFPTVQGATTTPVYTDAGKNQANRKNVSVTPYKGDRMLRLWLPNVSGFKQISGLTAGKTYNLSFWVYHASEYFRLDTAEVASTPFNNVGRGSNSNYKIFTRFTLPTETVTEEYLKDDGTTGTASVKKVPENYYGKWAQVTITFKPTSNVAYLGLKTTYNSTANTTGYIFIDELTVTQECAGHTFDNDIADADCNNCGAIREYPTSWNFENGSTQNLLKSSDGVTMQVVDAVDQPEKIGSKYLKFGCSAAGQIITFNFEYEQGYKYIVSYDFKTFDYGTTDTNNFISLHLVKYNKGKLTDDAGKYPTQALNLAENNVITRYWENGDVFNQVQTFSAKGEGKAQCQDYYKVKTDGVTTNEITSGGAIWDGWQHFEIEVGANNDHEGLVSFGFRNLAKNSVVGIDNFKVEKVAVATINAADEAFDGTFAYNIRNNKAGTEQGLRFKSNINLNDLGNGAKIVEYGTLAYKKSDAGKTFLTREAAKDMAKNGYVVAGVAYDEVNDIDLRYEYDTETNVVTYTGVLTGIAPKYYKTEFNVRAYVVIETADGVRTTVYDDVETLSVFSAATNIVNANANADDVAAARAALNAYDGVNA